jgi:hypothetical protein
LKTRRIVNDFPKPLRELDTSMEDGMRLYSRMAYHGAMQQVEDAQVAQDMADEFHR